MGKLLKLSKREWAAKADKTAIAAARKAARREKLILDHAFLVDKLALHVQRKMTHLDLDDLRQAGYVGLLEAADRFKPRSGVFEHFAYFRVRGAMIDAHKRISYKDETMTSLDFLEERDGYLPRYLAEDKCPLPDAQAARHEEVRLLSQALSELPDDEKKVFRASLCGVTLISQSAANKQTVAWTRAKLASAKATLGAKVLMWGLGLDKVA